MGLAGYVWSGKGWPAEPKDWVWRGEEARGLKGWAADSSPKTPLSRGSRWRVKAGKGSCGRRWKEERRIA